MLPTCRVCVTAVVCMLGLAVLAAPARAVDPKFLPDDAELVLTINLQQILNSELAKANKDVVTRLKFLLDGQLADAGAQRYLERIDFDLFRDVTNITIATDGGKMPSFILLEGKFNAEKINAIGEEASRDNAEHIKGVKIAGQQAFEIRINADDRPVFAGVLGKDKLIAADSKDGFADAVSRIKGSAQPSKLKKELRDLLGPAAAKQSIILATTGPALVKLLDGTPVPNIEDLQEVLGGVTALNVAIAMDKNATFELVVNSRDKKSADEMAKLAGVGVAGAKLLLKKKVETDPQYAPALDIVSTLRVTSQGTNFVLRGEVAAAVLAKLLKELPK
jgi:hypothetical protein